MATPTKQIGFPLLHDLVIDSARRLPEKVALVCRGQRITYREIDQRSNAFANVLVHRGVRRGDRVIIYGDNFVETVISFWGVLKANAVASIVNPLTKAEKLAYLLNDCRATVLVTDAHLLPVFEEAVTKSKHLKAVVISSARAADPARLQAIAGAVDWDAAVSAERDDVAPRRESIDIDLAAIIYTSGSTGEPKGVMLTHRNMLAASLSITTLLENTEEDVILSVLPLAFNYGLYQMIMAFRMGARLVLERSFAYPAQLFQAMEREQVTGFPGVPTMFALLTELKTRGDRRFASVRYLTNTAAELTVKHIEGLKALFPKAQIFSMYGLTECKRCTWLPPEDIDRKPTSVGIAIPNTELWIVDENDRKLGPNEVGQLVIRGATVMRGYWDKPVETAKSLRPGPLPGELVLYTGDYCRLDEEGYLYFVGRMDDIIKSRGEKVPPKEVESAIQNIEGVRECAVIGVPDAVLGTAVKAFVVLESGAQLGEKDIIARCQRRLESYMVPKFVELVSELPRTDTGKIKKTGLS